jgi:hypothetical protein
MHQLCKQTSTPIIQSQWLEYYSACGAPNLDGDQYNQTNLQYQIRFKRF